MNAPAPAPAPGPLPSPERSPATPAPEMEPVAVLPSTAPSVSIHSLETLPTGFRGAFLERRFRDDGQVDSAALVKAGTLAFLAKADHIDEMYQVDGVTEVQGVTLQPGLYRIRHQGSDLPLVTLKHHGDGVSELSQTIDVVHPDHDVLDLIRAQGKLQCILEKTRVTYVSKSHPNCILCVDEVRGVGRFCDLKGDSPQAMERFVADLGLCDVPLVTSSYLDLKREVGISPVQLKAWRINERFEDYILGIVSGTLTPLGFLSAALAADASKMQMIIALLTVGFCDGFSDAAAAAQATQSNSRATGLTQVTMLGKTLLGKIAVPLTFVPIVVASPDPILTQAAACAWGATLLGSTAAVQALAHERPLLRELKRTFATCAGAVAVGVVLGQYLPGLLKALLG